MPGRIPKLDKSEAPLPTMEAHAHALEQACRAAAQIIAARPDRAGIDVQEPLPASSVRALQRLPRCND